MPILHLEDVPCEVYDRLRQLATSHNSTPEVEALRLLRQEISPRPTTRSQAELLAELRRRSFTPPAGTPDSVALLAEDRGR